MNDLFSDITHVAAPLQSTGVLFQQVLMLANRYLVIMDIDDLVQLDEAVNSVGHQ